MEFGHREIQSFNNKNRAFTHQDEMLGDSQDPVTHSLLLIILSEQHSRTQVMARPCSYLQSAKDVLPKRRGEFAHILERKELNHITKFICLIMTFLMCSFLNLLFIVNEPHAEKPHPHFFCS